MKDEDLEGLVALIKGACRTDDDAEIMELLRDLVTAERERCAAVVENWGKPPNPAGVRASIAAQIRSGQ